MNGLHAFANLIILYSLWSGKSNVVGCHDTPFLRLNSRATGRNEILDSPMN
jgi:hypothetical protein